MSIRLKLWSFNIFGTKIAVKGKTIAQIVLCKIKALDNTPRLVETLS
jgi:hypothetical protein